MSFAGRSNNTQQTLPTDDMSTLLEEFCDGDPYCIDPTGSTFGLSREFGSDADAQSLDSLVSVIHEGWVFPKVKTRDYVRISLANGIGRVMLGDEVEPVRQQLQQSEQGSIEVSGKLGDWPAFRQQCKTLDDEIQANATLAADLKGYVKGCLHIGWIEADADAYFRKKIAESLLEEEAPIITRLKALGYNGLYEQAEFLAGLPSSTFLAALCGWPTGGVPHKLSSAQAAIAIEFGKVDVMASRFFEIEEAA